MKQEKIRKGDLVLEECEGIGTYIFIADTLEGKEIITKNAYFLPSKDSIIQNKGIETVKKAHLCPSIFSYKVLKHNATEKDLENAKVLLIL